MILIHVTPETLLGGGYYKNNNFGMLGNFGPLGMLAFLVDEENLPKLRAPNFLFI